MNILTPEEVTICQMALSGIIEDLEEVGKNIKYPFTPEARKQQRDMLSAAKSAHQKLAAASGKNIQLDPYNPGDESEFFTKQS